MTYGFNFLQQIFPDQLLTMKTSQIPSPACLPDFGTGREKIFSNQLPIWETEISCLGNQKNFSAQKIPNQTFWAWGTYFLPFDLWMTLKSLRNLEIFFGVEAGVYFGVAVEAVCGWRSGRPK